MEELVQEVSLDEKLVAIKEILLFYRDKKRYLPTLEEIAAALNERFGALHLKATIRGYLIKMDQAGTIKIHRSRGGRVMTAGRYEIFDETSTEHKSADTA